MKSDEFRRHPAKLPQVYKREPIHAAKLMQNFRISRKYRYSNSINDRESRLSINAIKTNWIQIKGCECRSLAYILAFVQEFLPFPLKSYLSSPGKRQRERMTYISSKFPYFSRRESNFVWRGDFRILLCNLKGNEGRRKKYWNPRSSVMKRASSSLLSPDLVLQHWLPFEISFS